jgi:hypothetical protein
MFGSAKPEPRAESRIRVLASEGKIVESAALPGRWLIAASGVAKARERVGRRGL